MKTNVFTPSVYQSALFDWIVNGSGSAIVKAVAGSGKTTTLVHSISLMIGKSVFFGAYNKKIASEIEEKVKGIGHPNISVSTLHAAGFKAWRRAVGNVVVNADKNKINFRNASANSPELSQLEGPVVSLVSYAKQAAFGIAVDPNEDSEWKRLLWHFDVDTLDNDDTVIKLAKKLLKISIEQNKTVIDFDDMIFAPLYHKAKFFKYDWVLIDEAQDTNVTRRLLARAMLKDDGRVIAIGDEHQAIYGFTGADADALDLIAEEFKAKVFPLSTSYRCPKSVVAYAQKYVSHIHAAENADEGEVKLMQEDEKLTSFVVPGDAILCRFNAPVVKTAYSFIAAGIPAKVEGREIGSGLKALVRRWKSKSFDELLTNIEKYQVRETEKFRAKEQDNKISMLEDRIECVKVLIDRVMRVDPKTSDVVGRICQEIDSIFGDDVGKEVVLLSTIHKSKGREWNRVVWLQTGPSKYARLDWELVQENNLCYVAATRAKNQLVLCNNF